MGPQRWDSITPEGAKGGPQLELPIDPRELAVEAYFVKHSVARHRILTAEILKPAVNCVVKKWSSTSKAIGSFSWTVRISQQSGDTRGGVELLQTQRQKVPALKAAIEDLKAGRFRPAGKNWSTME